MLRNMKDMEDCAIGATDGVIGLVRDFYFDDDAWVIRYLVVAAADRRVLISPMSIGQADWSEKILPVSLTQAQVRGSPDIDTDKPVSRQQEMGYLGYYGYPNYWGGGGLWGGSLYPDMLQAGVGPKRSGTAKRRNPSVAGGVPVAAGIARQAHPDPHLRSGNAVVRYYVHASDGDIGHVQGFLIDERSWAIRYLIVNTSNWWLGHDVLIAPDWISNVSWAESMVSVDLTRHAVKQSPPYNAATPLDSDYEARLHAHYSRDAYRPRGTMHSGTSSRSHL